MTKTKKLTAHKAVKAAELYEAILDAKYNHSQCTCGCNYGKPTMNELKAQFRKVLELPVDFRLTEHRFNLLSDDLNELLNSYTTVGQKGWADLLADTLATYKFPSPYARRMSADRARGFHVSTK
jgi:hypothetical protein